MPRKRAAPAQRHIDAPGLDRLAVISAELTEGPTRTRGARGSAGDQVVETEGRVAKRQRLAGPGQDECATAEEARVMSMYLHRSMQQLSQLNADLSVLWPIINSKQFLSCQEHDVGQTRENSPADANQPQNQQQIAQQTDLAPVYQELLRLRASVEGIFGHHVPIPLPPAAGIDMATIMGSFRSIQTAVDALQQQLSLRPNPEEIKTLVSPALDRLWMQSRLAAEEEMREKLYLWKYKALDLKQSLQATIASRTSAAASASSQAAVSPTNSLDDTRTLNVLRSALDFVSSLYLLEVVNDPGSNPTNFRKERSMAETASALGENIYELQLDQRSRMLPPVSGYSTAAGHASFIPMYPPREHQLQRYHQQYLDPQTQPSHSVQGVLVVPSEDPSQHFSQQPPQQPLIASEEQVISNGALQPVQPPNQPPPLTPPPAPVNAFDPNFSDASDPPEEDEPLPVVAPIQSSAAEKGTLELEGKTTQEPERVKTNKPTSNPTSTPVQAAGALTKSSHNRETSRGKQPSLPRRKMTITAPRSAGLVPTFHSRTGVSKKQPVVPVERGAVEAVAAAAAARIMGGSGSNNRRKAGIEPPKAENEVLEKANDSKTAAGSAPRSMPPKSGSQVAESVQVASDVPPGQGKSSKANKLPHQSMLYGGVIKPFRGPNDLPSEEESDESESATDTADKSTESGDGNTAQRPTTSATDSGSSTPTSGSGSSVQRGVSTGCAICQKNDSYAQLLLCDNDCGREYHTFCLSPPLSKIPEGDWYCPRCLSVEHVENGNIFKCSASSCDKITGARYCSLHRCREPHCLNRIKAGGFCRRHELFRSRPKRARPPSVTRITLRPSNAVIPEEASLDSSDAGLPIPMNRVRLPPRIRALAPAPPPDQAPPPDAETSTDATTKAPINPTSSVAPAKTPPPPPARPKERAKIPLKNIAPKRADPPQGTDSSERPTSPQRTGTAARSAGASQRSAPRTTASIIAAAKSAADKAAAERTKSSNVSRS